MLEFKTNGKRGSYKLTLPTKLSEITVEYLEAVTKDVKPADNYTLIAVCYREKLSTIIMNAKQNKAMTTAVVPIYVKRSFKDVKDINIPLSITDKVIISGSDLSLGHHVICPNNSLTINNFVSYVEGDGFAYQNALKLNAYVYFLEFKLVPNCAIVGAYKEINKDEEEFINPFKEVKLESGELN